MLQLTDSSKNLSITCQYEGPFILVIDSELEQDYADKDILSAGIVADIVAKHPGSTVIGYINSSVVVYKLDDDLSTQSI